MGIPNDDEHLNTHEVDPNTVEEGLNVGVGPLSVEGDLRHYRYLGGHLVVTGNAVVVGEDAD